MPNNKGGKGYKKGKHSNEDEIFHQRQPDQMYARVIRLLGNCNILCYCNDKKQRICHIRGKLRSKQWMTVGDIVIISVRDFETNKSLFENSPADKKERGDVIAKYTQNQHAQLKKLRDINPELFLNVEHMDNNRSVAEQEYNGIEFENSSGTEDENDEENKSENSEENIPRIDKAKARMNAISGGDEFNIDDI
jgi:translation initiation factor 1A